MGVNKISFQSYSKTGQNKNNGWSLFEQHKIPFSAEDDTSISLFVFLEYNKLGFDSKKKLIEIDKKAFQSLKEDNSSENMEEALERVVKSLNLYIPVILGESESNWVESFSGLILLTDGQEIHIASSGAVNVFLVRNKKLIEICHPNKEERNALKIFEDITTGEIQIHDNVFVTNETLLDYLSQDKIKFHLQLQNNKDCIHNISQLVLHAHDQHNFIFGNIRVETKEEVIPQTVAATHTSINPQKVEPILLVEKQQDTIPSKEIPQTATKTITEDYLTHVPETLSAPSLEEIGPQKVVRQSTRNAHKDIWKQASTILQQSGNEAQNFYKKITQFLKRKNTRRVDPAHNNRIERSVSNSQIETPGFVFVIQRIARSIFGSLAILFLTLFGNKKTTLAIEKKIDSGTQFFVQLPLKQKITVIVTLIFFFLTVNSLIYIGQQKIQVENKRGFDDIILSIEQKTLSAEAALIYNDYDQASLLVQAAENLLTSIEPSNKIEEKQYQDIQDRLSQSKKKVERIVDVDVSLLADLKSQHPDASPMKALLRGKNDEVFVLNDEQKDFYVLKKTDGKSVKFSMQNVSTIQDITSSPDQILILTQDKNLFGIGKDDKKVQNIPINLHGDTTKLGSFEFFNNNLYLLDTAIGQIYKHSKQIARYGNATKWVKDNQGYIRESKDMYVDGEVITIDKQGTLSFYLKGSLRQKVPLKINPAPNDIQKVIHIPDTEINYLLSGTQRIIKSDTNGKVIAQYNLSDIGSIQDIAAESDGSSLYVLSGTQIYTFDTK